MRDGSHVELALTELVLELLEQSAATASKPTTMVAI
jgi:hypothetical protein